MERACSWQREAGRAFKRWGWGWGDLAGCLSEHVFPALQLKSERELDKIKGLKLEELWLDGNTLCDSFRDQSTYIRSVTSCISPPGDFPPREAERMHPDHCPSAGDVQPSAGATCPWGGSRVPPFCLPVTPSFAPGLLSFLLSWLSICWFCGLSPSFLNTAFSRLSLPFCFKKSISLSLS